MGHITEKNPYTDYDFLNDVYLEEEDLAKIRYLASKTRNIILQGAPGTGKSFAALSLAALISGRKIKNDPRVEFIQFHSESCYENFIYGWRPNPTGGFRQYPGGFVRFCRKAQADPEHTYTYIIDEINRADMGKVFGIVGMAMETSHRGRPVPLPFDELDENGKPTGKDVQFIVPQNVIIIGIINTADHELNKVDYALRRRFAFYTMHPAFKLVRNELVLNARFKREIDAFQQPDGSNPLLNLVRNVAFLNKEMAADKMSFGKGFCIGHSYFCGLDASDPEKAIHQVLEYELKPLIEEYCFHDADTARRWTNILTRAAE